MNDVCVGGGGGGGVDAVLMETICMKCQILFSGKKKKNIINLPSADLSKAAIMVKRLYGGHTISPVARYSVDIVNIPGPLGLLGSYIIFENRLPLIAARVMKYVAFCIIP